MQRKQAGGTLMGMFVGLVMGIVIAAGVVWYLNRTQAPFGKPATAPDKADIAKAPATTATAPAAAPQELPAKPGDKPRFDFYKILPGNQETAPAPSAAPAEAGESAVSTPAVESFYLQAGAFQKRPEADNMKAKLALAGVEASVSEVTVADKGKMFRVRSGPYAKADEMNRVRNQLSQSGIQATVVKIKE